LKLKELITLVLLGLGLGALALGYTSRRNPPEPPPEPFPEAGLPGGAVEVDPRWSQLNPTAVDSIDYVFEKTFGVADSNDFRPREARPPGHLLHPGESLTVEVATKKATLGLILEARASTPGQEISSFRSPTHREGVNLKPELPDEAAPRLIVSWDGEQMARFPLETLYWRLYYARVDGDGDHHRLTLMLEQAEGAPAFEGAIKKICLFSQDTQAAGDVIRIGLREAALRSEALRRKIILLGLDGLSWRIVDPLLEQGKLPNLQKLIEQGVRAPLADEPPLDSPKIWTTIATGRHPAAHGIDKRVYRSENSADPIPVNSTLRKTKALWNQFSDLGRTVGFVNWFITWPAEAVNGFMVSDRARFGVSHAVYPEILGSARSRFLASEEDLARDSSPFARQLKALRRVLEEDAYPARNLVERNEYVALVKRMEEVYFNDSFFLNYGLDLYQTHRPDLFALYFHGTDAISHAFYKFRFPEESFDVTGEQRQVLGDPIESIYRFHDRTLGRLMEAADPGTTWAVMSDHGFQAQPVELEKIYIWDLDSLLEALGLLSYKEGSDIDWSRSICYTSRQLEWNPVAFLCLNLQGREKEGIVAPEDFRTEMKRVAQALRSITYERSGRPVFQVEVEREARRHGRHDLRVQPMLDPEDFSDRILIAGRTAAPSDIFTVVPLSGTHQLEGVLVLSGPGVRKGVQLGQVHTVDVAPTLLELAGLPVGEDLDGRVSEEALEPAYLDQAPVRTIPSYELIGTSENHPSSAGPDFSAPEIDGQLLDTMRGLGYIR